MFMVLVLKTLREFLFPPLPLTPRLSTVKRCGWREWLPMYALTVVYCISGIAVNHIEDWNPNYKFSQSEINVGALPEVSYPEM